MHPDSLLFANSIMGQQIPFSTSEAGSTSHIFCRHVVASAVPPLRLIVHQTSVMSRVHLSMETIVLFALKDHRVAIDGSY